MDLAGLSEPVFQKIKAECREFLKKLSVEPLTFIPISACDGVNLIRSSKKHFSLSPRPCSENSLECRH